jgi:uncharacterized protein (DUF2141 family)
MKTPDMTKRAILAAALLMAATPADAQVLGSDAAACSAGGGSAILVQVTGLKDRKGRIKLELYPATEADFLKDDDNLVAEGIPAGPATPCEHVHPSLRTGEPFGQHAALRRASSSPCDFAEAGS